MNFRFLPAVSVIASLILPSKLLFSAIEFVPSPVFPRSPSANFAYGEDESLQLTVSVRGMEVDLNAIAVSVTNGNGKTVKARATSTPGVFEIQPSEEGLLKVRMEPPASLSGELASGEADVYFGNYDEGIRKLETRRKKLGVLPEAIGLLEAQIEDQRLWLEHWLQEQGKESHLSDNAPVQGQLATAFRLAWDLVSQHEKGKKAVMREWGKQLPARRSFLARAAGAKREVGFDYILRIPEGAPKKQYPLVVIVHGFTANPNIIGGMRPEIDEAAARMDFPFITAAPVFDGDMREKRGWSPDELAGFVESLADRFPVDRNRIYLSGFSMGGLAVNRLTAHRPDLFAAVAPLCGTGDPAWAEAMAPVPVYFYHGDEDTAVSCYRSKVMYEALKAVGADPQMKIYKGMGHPVWSAAYREPEFYKKLLQHIRLPALNHPTIGAQQTADQEAKLESMHDLPDLVEPFVCWIDKSFSAGDLFQGRTIRGQTVSRLEMLYPDLPITGNILVALPEGMKGAHSPIRIGIALESNSAVPDGFVVESLRAEGPVAMLCYSTSAEDLTEAAREYRILTDAKGDSKRGLLLEWYFSDSRDGNRFAIRSIKQ